MFSRINIYYILLFSLLVKIAMFLYIYLTNDLTVFHYPDTKTYMQPIINLLKTGSYVLDNGNFETTRPPLYPAVLGIGYLLGHTEVIT